MEWSGIQSENQVDAVVVVVLVVVAALRRLLTAAVARRCHAHRLIYGLWKMDSTVTPRLSKAQDDNERSSIIAYAYSPFGIHMNCYFGPFRSSTRPDPKRAVPAGYPTNGGLNGAVCTPRPFFGRVAYNSPAHNGWKDEVPFLPSSFFLPSSLLPSTRTRPAKG